MQVPDTPMPGVVGQFKCPRCEHVMYAPIRNRPEHVCRVAGTTVEFVLQGRVDDDG